MKTRFLAPFAIALVACGKTRGPAVVETPDAAPDVQVSAPAPKVVDAGARSFAGPLVWSRGSKRLAYLRGDDLYFVETERFTVERKIKLPHLEMIELVLLQSGGALVFGSEGTASLQKVVIVKPSGELTIEELGTEMTIATETDEAGVVLSPAFVEEEAGTFTRLVVEDREDASQPARVALEVRALADAKVKSRTKLPTWFHARMGMPPNRLGCRGTLCAFAVAPANAQPTFEDDTLTLAIFDVKDRSPKLLPSVLLGPSPGVAFGPKNQLAVTFGSEADPVLIDPKTLAVRALGRRGKKVDFMHATACIAFSADGALIASTADGEPVSLFEIATGKRRWRSPEDATSVAHWQTCGIAFDADGNVLDYSALGNIQKLDIGTGKKLQDLHRAQIHPGGPRAVGNESWDSGATVSARATFFVVSTVQQADTLLDTRSWKTEPLKAGGAFDPEERFYVVDEQVIAMTTRKPIATLP